VNDLQSTIVIPREEIGDVEITADILYHAVQEFARSPGIEDIVDFIAKKNDSYGGSWSTDGLFINLADIKDKLSRVSIILEHGNLSEEMATADNYGDAILDLWVRTTLCLMWDRHVKDFIRSRYGIDMDEKDMSGEL